MQTERRGDKETSEQTNNASTAIINAHHRVSMVELPSVLSQSRSSRPVPVAVINYCRSPLLPLHSDDDYCWLLPMLVITMTTISVNSVGCLECVFALTVDEPTSEQKLQTVGELRPA